MGKTNYSYIGISFVILLFGIWAVPKIVEHFSDPNLATIGPVPEFSFTNQDGKNITNNDYKGKVYVVEFFFTTCNDICPIMNTNMKRIQNEFLGNPNVGIASFSIDPDYDTPQILKEYAEAYSITDPDWHLLTGKKGEIMKLSNEGFNLYAAEGMEPDEAFQHSGFFALIDQNGTIRSRLDDNENPIIYYDGLTAEGVQMLIEDIKKLL